MANLLKIPSHIRQEFLRRLYSEGLCDQNIDLVIDDMWCRFEVGEYTVKRHNEVREALEVSNPLSTKCQKKWKDYWESLPTLGVQRPTDKAEALLDRHHRRVAEQIRWIENRIGEAQSKVTDPKDVQHVEMLYKHLARLKRHQLSVIERYLGRDTAQGGAASENIEIQRLLALFGVDDSPADGNHAMSSTNGGAAGRI